jgi:hypothetical protein
MPTRRYGLARNADELYHACSMLLYENRMILRIIFYFFMVLMIFGFSIAVEMDDWFFWTIDQYGHIAALAAIIAFGFVLEAIVRLYAKLEKMTRQ